MGKCGVGAAFAGGSCSYAAGADGSDYEVVDIRNFAAVGNRSGIGGFGVELFAGGINGQIRIH